MRRNGESAQPGAWPHQVAILGTTEDVHPSHADISVSLNSCFSIHHPNILSLLTTLMTSPEPVTDVFHVSWF